MEARYKCDGYDVHHSSLPTFVMLTWMKMNYISKNSRTQKRGRAQRPRGRRPRQQRSSGGGHPGTSPINLVSGNERAMAFRRTCTQNISLNEQNGWNNAGYDIEMSFSLAQVLIYIAGTLVYTVPFTAAAEFTALFAEYRIKRASVRMFYNNNNSSLSSAATLSLPLITAVFDPTDVNATSLTSVLQYPNARTYQLGNGAEAPPCLNVTPKVLSNVGGGTAPIVLTAPWLITDLPTVPHTGVKLVYDPSNAVGSTVIGSVNFYIDIDFECRIVN